MISLNVGAMRQTAEELRFALPSSANDLVRQTLARHGLMPDSPDTQTGSVPQPMPSMADLMSRLQIPSAGLATPGVVIPDGATFEADRFDCDAGGRRYLTYVPASASDGVTGIVLMLHGCTQTSEDFSVGTGLNALAEQHGFVVIYPQQSRGDNAQSCWNWFSRVDQRRDAGEPAILAGLTRTVMAKYNVSPEAAFVAGLSAGAAMAVVLGETYPDVFAGVCAHSGLPFGAARDVPSAFAAMAGNAMDASAPRSDLACPRTIIFHGTADHTVHPSNGDRIAQRFRDSGQRENIVTDENGTIGGRAFDRTVTMGPDGTILMEQWRIDGLGHAWSGGNRAGSYADPAGPDASAEMVRFFFGDTIGTI